MSKKYEEAGVSLENGYKSVEMITEDVNSTLTDAVMSKLGSFNALYDLSKSGIIDPILVSGCDGVGTKILLAEQFNDYRFIGQDLVAMSVNDILVQGAQPLFFLDYIACGKNDPKIISQIVKSIANACKEVNCALVGGETAEMPDCYKPGSHDLAGFVVGAVSRTKLVDSKKVSPGDVIVSVSSSGLHSNGFSLVRKLLFKDNDVDLEMLIENQTLKQHLLTPTKLYEKHVRFAVDNLDVKGMSHITGGGIFENLERSLNGYGATIDMSKVNVLKIFDYLKSLSKMTDDEMFNYFNMGVGYVIITNQNDAQTLCDKFEDCSIIGEVVMQEGVKLENCRTC